jgi:hypothetical protein
MMIAMAKLINDILTTPIENPTIEKARETLIYCNIIDSDDNITEEYKPYFEKIDKKEEISK